MELKFFFLIIVFSLDNIYLNLYCDRPKTMGTSTFFYAGNIEAENKARQFLESLRSLTHTVTHHINSFVQVIMVMLGLCSF